MKLYEIILLVKWGQIFVCPKVKRLSYKLIKNGDNMIY